MAGGALLGSADGSRIRGSGPTGPLFGAAALDNGKVGKETADDAGEKKGSRGVTVVAGAAGEGGSALFFVYVRDGVYGLSARSIKSRGRTEYSWWILYDS